MRAVPLALPVQEAVDKVKRSVGGWWSRKAIPGIELIERKPQHLKIKKQAAAKRFRCRHNTSGRFARQLITRSLMAT